MRRWWWLFGGIALAIFLVWSSAGRTADRAGAPRHDGVTAGGHEPLAAATMTTVDPPSESAREARPQPEAAPRGAESSSTLVVRLLDPSGAALEGFDVAVTTPSIEPEELAFPERRIQTDSEGRARFEGVPAETRLVVALRAQDFYERRERVRAGKLVADGTPGSEPLYVARGESLAVELLLGTRTRIRGIVLQQGLGPVADALVYAVAAPPESGASGSTRTGADGSFVLELLACVPVAAVDVSAEVRRPGSLLQPKPPTHSAAAHVALSGPPPAETSVTLVLAPTLAIAGRVVEADGRPAQASLRARRRGDDSGPRAERITQVRDGAFRFNGLVAGDYEIEVRADQHGSSATLATIAAGREDVLLELPPSPSARLLLEVSTAAGLAGSSTIVLGHLVDPSAAIEVATLAREVTLVEPLGALERRDSLNGGGGSFRSRQGSVDFTVGPRETPCELELAADLWWLEARGTDALGRPLFPAGTGLVRLAEGEHRVRIELVPATTLTGRVEGTHVKDELCVALALADGRLVPLDAGRGDLRAANPLDSRGGFRFESAPTGTFELRIGTAAELAAGRARLRQKLTLRASEPAELLLTL